ncbi:hypothetical protein BKA64DRAFT_461204 [Cadophora sp. MPI-SDFR-AT-0126]|nr:hypothetical protein BKA64DRAFT_461204 [Leotiomycetes sp. MPI-SDFR-AT-0126]
MRFLNPHTLEILTNPVGGTGRDAIIMTRLPGKPGSLVFIADSRDSTPIDFDLLAVGRGESKCTLVLQDYPGMKHLLTRPRKHSQSRGDHILVLHSFFERIQGSLNKVSPEAGRFISRLVLLRNTTPGFIKPTLKTLLSRTRLPAFETWAPAHGKGFTSSASESGFSSKLSSTRALNPVEKNRPCGTISTPSNGQANDDSSGRFR